MKGSPFSKTFKSTQIQNITMEEKRTWMGEDQPKQSMYENAIKVAEQWWCTPLIPALGRQRQVDLCEFEASLVYKS